MGKSSGRAALEGRPVRMTQLIPFVERLFHAVPFGRHGSMVSGSPPSSSQGVQDCVSLGLCVVFLCFGKVYYPRASACPRRSESTQHLRARLDRRVKAVQSFQLSLLSCKCTRPSCCGKVTCCLSCAWSARVVLGSESHTPLGQRSCAGWALSSCPRHPKGSTTGKQFHPVPCSPGPTSPLGPPTCPLPHDVPHASFSLPIITDATYFFGQLRGELRT